MLVEVLRSFGYSDDGINSRPATAGDQADIPDELVPGLEASGFVRSPERKVIESAPENKRIVTKGPKGLWFVMEDGRRAGRGYPTEQEAREAI